MAPSCSVLFWVLAILSLTSIIRAALGVVGLVENKLAVAIVQFNPQLQL